MDVHESGQDGETRRLDDLIGRLRPDDTRFLYSQDGPAVHQEIARRVRPGRRIDEPPAPNEDHALAPPATR